jgi:hypothetical protein
MPGDIVISHTNIYRVQTNQPVQLQVTIGDGQVGGTALTLNGVPVPFDNTGGQATVDQPGASLVGSILQCATTVQDINPATNNTSVIYRLTGGLAAQEFPFSAQVTADSGLARYLITFLLAA